MSFSGSAPLGFCGSIVTRLKTPRLYRRLCDSTTSPSRSGTLTLMCTSRWITPREVHIRVKEPLREGDVVESQSRLSSLGVFNRVTIEDPEVVQTPLRFHDVPFPERFLDSDVHLSMDHS